jgi:hypothetical protein
MENCTGDNIVDRISRTECIGNSLTKINNNFTKLDQAICQTNNDFETLENLLVNESLADTFNARLSLSPVNPTPSSSIKQATNIYLHPYKGNLIPLWDEQTGTWQARYLNYVVTKSLSECLAATNYDVFLHYANDAFHLHLEPWLDQTAGAVPSPLDYKKGIPVKPLDPSKRFIGCMRTTAACQTEMNYGYEASVGGSHPKLYLWNAYNQVPLTFSILDSGYFDLVSNNLTQFWTTTPTGATAAANGPYEKFANNVNNRVSFISRDDVFVNLVSTYNITNGTTYYFAHSLDAETPTVAQLLEKTPGVPIFEAYGNQPMSHSFNRIIAPGYHYIQLVTMTYENKPATFSLWTGNRHSCGTTGYVGKF